ncbi:[Fe-S]-dependent transcriptional repressor FeoC [Erwinia sp. HR93]|uniref:[Fe-S]-dependent transcriptional repressor FeoC n=1 Tax=Erwinia sp. HR93 TaxID=3094840 RepID=UPI002ADEF07C|nr:[Fe-S]-dependent transcriptional repressor FeoC [Erwinia sp. HR93]MEA1063080.1 [Fe-S]-dependent transcriptional repressor FeoC [Erwinia sp. HR93]
MAGLREVRDLLALQGRMEARSISAQLNVPLPRIEALLNHLEMMGKAQRTEMDSSSCLTGSCRRCPEATRCTREYWSLR